MKKVIGIILAVVSMASVGQALNNVESGIPNTTSGTVVSETGLAQNKNYILDINSSLKIKPNSAQGDVLAAQLVVASVTFSSATFKDGAQSSGTITVVSTQPLVGIAGTATLTVSTNSVMAGAPGSDTIVILSTSGISGSSITVAGQVYWAGSDYAVGATTAATATNLAAVLDNRQNPAPPFGALFTATVSGSSVTLSCVTNGVFCNSFAVVSATTNIKVANATMTGGSENTTFNVNGNVFVQGIDWKQAALSSNTAVSIAQGVNARSSTAGVTASTTAATVVTLTCSNTGTFCNSYTLTTSTGALAPSAATFSGGQNPAILSIAGYNLTQGAPQGPGVWAIGASTTATAINISSAITNTPGLNALVIATTGTLTGRIVFTTSTVAGSAYNYTMLSSTPTALSVIGMQGGVDPAYAVGTPTITLASTAFTTGLQVAYSTTSAVGITGLTFGTTYFVGVIDSNHIGLATSLANAQAGTFVTLASSKTTTAGDSFGLVPAPITGTGSWQWQASNDGVNFVNISSTTYGVGLSSASLPTPYTATSFIWDIGEYHYRYLNLKATAPSTGAVAFSLYLNVKDASTAR